jgi:hypothetical protein
MCPGGGPRQREGESCWTAWNSVRALLSASWRSQFSAASTLSNDAADVALALTAVANHRPPERFTSCIQGG